jgi:tetratricopeptide (TPR) repeat protein
VSLEHAGKAGSTLRQARAEGGLGDAYYQQGAMLTAFRHFDRCVELGETHGHAGVVSPNLAMRGLTLLYQNRLQDALADGHRALELAQQSSNLRHQVLAHNVVAGVESFHGDFDAGMEHARRTLELGERIGSRRFVVDAMSQMAHMLWSEGRLDEARQTLDAVDRVLGQSLLPFAGAYVRGLQAACAVTPAERRSYLAAGERLLGHRAVSHCHVYFYFAAMEACLAANERDQALRHAAGLATYTRAEPLPFADFFIRRTKALAGDSSAQERATLIEEAGAAGLTLALRLLEAT